MKLATHLTSKERIYDNLEHLNLVVTLIQSESQHRAKTKHFLPFSLSLTLFDLCPLLFSPISLQHPIFSVFLFVFSPLANRLPTQGWHLPHLHKSAERAPFPIFILLTSSQLYIFSSLGKLPNTDLECLLIQTAAFSTLLPIYLVFFVRSPLQGELIDLVSLFKTQ